MEQQAAAKNTSSNTITSQGREDANCSHELLRVWRISSRFCCIPQTPILYIATLILLVVAFPSPYFHHRSCIQISRFRIVVLIVIQNCQSTYMINAKHSPNQVYINSIDLNRFASSTIKFLSNTSTFYRLFHARAASKCVSQRIYYDLGRFRKILKIVDTNRIIQTIQNIPWHKNPSSPFRGGFLY